MRTLHRINHEYTPKCFCNAFGADDAAIAAAAIGAAGSVGGAAINGISAGNLNKKNRKWQEEQAAKQMAWNEAMWNKTNEWNLAQWERQNAYNTPSAQLERLKEAGLNPLFYGLDGSNADAMSSAQALGYERASSNPQLNPVGEGIAAALQMAQLANIEAQTNKTKAEAGAINAKLPYEIDEIRSRVRSSNLSSDAQETINSYLDQQQQAELRMKNATANEADAAVQKALAEIDKMDYEKTTMYMSWLETQEKILNLQKQRDLTDKQMDELSALIGVYNNQAKKLGLDIQNYDDITVIGTASSTVKMGPFTVQQGEPITLGMKKAAEQHQRELQEKQKAKKTNNQSYGATTQGSPYEGPIYD